MNKNKPDREIHVFAHWVGMEQPQRMGVLFAQTVRGTEALSFEYDKKWLDAKVDS